MSETDRSGVPDLAELVSIPMRPALRLLSGVLGVLALSLVSPPGDRIVDHFVVEAVNTQERAELTMVGADAVPDAESLATVRRLLRSYATNREGPLDARLVQVLYAIAKETGKPVQVVSGYRPPSHRHDHNYHVRGMAADVRVPGVGTYKLVKIARKLGVRGIGYYPTSQFVHVDVRDDAPFQWTDRSGPSTAQR
jgi:uncharacterized protein YcbK (DUF882 family)